MIKKLKLILFTLPILLLSLNAWGLKTDKDQPIDILADRLEMNDVTNISTYSGNVLLTQGSLKIKAETLILYFDNENKLDYMEMMGKPAHLTQLNKNNKTMRGKAEFIEYRDKESLLTLKRNAEFDSDGEHIESHYIRVDTYNDNIQAGKNDKKHRVRITILPRTKTP